ncbi:hypothetical protein SAMD00019534_111420 [Acytostelium subglobosum LB1]|uniref:hypothetical protein n=1 Tax=Acytostelium subglobosum LB1 TaxID=1410327 RepID=UPI000644DD0E|nr:hypothetical protein SAMD00019534_111420 [Acytostelium subglobosum LB1]GAM27966.1 hypothetical protein SAMD00019534_111420 [Acytostelium subglobosum LB1]|eukprot:XP_012749249.1 hypothetical protein SAMD00019534_111420 [Acytostelium subglobosum LB1]
MSAAVATTSTTMGVTPTSTQNDHHTNNNDDLLKMVVSSIASMDGLEQIAKATERGINSLKDIRKFFKLRAQIEDEYSKKLTQLAKVEPSVQSGCISATVMEAWAQIRQTASWEAAYHETLCNNLNDAVVGSIDTLLSALEKRSSTIICDINKSYGGYTEAVQKLRKSQQTWEKASKDLESASAASSPATQHIASRMSVNANANTNDTLRINRRMLKQSQDAIRINREHREHISETNTIQAHFYGQTLPHAIVDFSRLEIYRSHLLKQYFLKFINMISLPHYELEMVALRDKLVGLNSDTEVGNYIRRIKSSVNMAANPTPFELIDLKGGSVDGANTNTDENIAKSPILQPSSWSTTTIIDDSASTAAAMIVAEPIKEPITPIKSAQDSANSKSSSKDKEKDKDKDKKDRKSRYGLMRLGGGGKSKSTSNGKQPQTPQQHSGHGRPQFSVPLIQLMEQQKDTHPTLTIPYVLVVLKRYMIRMEAFTTEGIFRVPSKMSHVDETKKTLDEGNFDALDACGNVHTLSSLVKLWIRDLPEPVIPFNMYSDFVNSYDDADSMLAHFHRLPQLNQRVLSYVLEIMRLCATPENVKHTMMNYDNLATVFSPSLIRSSSPEVTFGSVSSEIASVKLMLEIIPVLDIEDGIEKPSIQQQQHQPIHDDSTSSSSGSNGSGGGRTSTSCTTSNGEATPGQAFASPMHTPQKSPMIISSTPSYNSSHPHTPRFDEASVTAPTTTIVTVTTPRSTTTTTAPQSQSHDVTPLLTPKVAATTPASNLTNDILCDSPFKESLQISLLQESIRQSIEDFHTQMIQSYLDVTTNMDVTAYHAMSMTYTIVKCCHWLEQFVTHTFKIRSFDNLMAEIEQNEFMSPPAVAFKIPSSTTKLTPLALGERVPRTLKRWVVMFTMVVNHASNYLCFLGGTMSKSPPLKGLLYETHEFFMKHKLLTPQEIQQSAHNQIDVEAAIKLVNGTIEMSKSYLPFTILPLIKQLEEQDQIEMIFDEHLSGSGGAPPPSITVADHSVKSTVPAPSVPPMSSPLTMLSVESRDTLVQPLTPTSTLNHQDLIRETSFLIIKMLDDRRDELTNGTWVEREQQIQLSTIAKQMNTVKSSLEAFIKDLNVPMLPSPTKTETVTPTTPPGAGPQVAATQQICNYTKTFIDKSILMIRSIVQDLSNLDTEHYKNVVKKLFEIKGHMAVHHVDGSA